MATGNTKLDKRGNNYGVLLKWVKEHGAWNKSENYVICKTCSKVFHTAPSNSFKFCSRVCYHNDMKKRRGSTTSHWKGGITPINKAIRTSLEYEEWRKSCMERDNYTCKHCGQIGGILHVDHIKRFSNFPELRLDLNNGQTLCKKCHILKTSQERRIRGDGYNKESFI